MEKKLLQYSKKSLNIKNTSKPKVDYTLHSSPAVSSEGWGSPSSSRQRNCNVHIIPDLKRGRRQSHRVVRPFAPGAGHPDVVEMVARSSVVRGDDCEAEKCPSTSCLGVDLLDEAGKLFQ